ncbi:uncharacterized protein TRAVEDRAFT_23578 [Trametes versicolor FP-101664 SS1]|uniref:uncharacterized protein n=1 Tax=Trametes versicolor (strain FP-101664) TaxID=717944 RepID=UPI0004622AD8|nr:uncharacterized protein TRAVEDRAFT_23578 [Trametes versicolor FP-101664 SS1]EIW54557.1 hypothetical protein TRAVEDRAFT_23578 [Trametes versicolor FP-101664 SS1]
MPAPDVLTYRYNGTMVYVTPAATYEEGIRFARQVFPELAAVAPEHILISVNGIVNKQRQLIRIGPMAWKTVVFSRARFEVLDVTLDPSASSPSYDCDKPEIVVSDADALPEYDSVKKLHPDEADFLVPSRAPSPPMLHGANKPMANHRNGRARSHSPTPSTTSNDSCSTLDWARSLFGKRVRS